MGRIAVQVALSSCYDFEAGDVIRVKQVDGEKYVLVEKLSSAEKKVFRVISEDNVLDKEEDLILSSEHKFYISEVDGSNDVIGYVKFIIYAKSIVLFHVRIYKEKVVAPTDEEEIVTPRSGSGGGLQK